MKKQINLPLIILLSFFSLSVAGQKMLTANEAADFVQRQRDTASNWYDKPGATKQDIERGIEELKASMRFLNSEQVKNISPKNPYLTGRNTDVLREMVYAYA